MAEQRMQVAYGREVVVTRIGDMISFTAGHPGRNTQRVDVTPDEALTLVRWIVDAVEEISPHRVYAEGVSVFRAEDKVAITMGKPFTGDATLITPKQARTLAKFMKGTANRIFPKDKKPERLKTGWYLVDTGHPDGDVWLHWVVKGRLACGKTGEINRDRIEDVTPFVVCSACTKAEGVALLTKRLEKQAAAPDKKTEDPRDPNWVEGYQQALKDVGLRLDWIAGERL